MVDSSANLTDIRKEYGLKACLNVIASGHLPGFKGAGQWVRPGLIGNFLNQLPMSSKSIRLGCWSHGPDNSDSYVEQEVDKFLACPGGRLILNLHGLDDEGWGPVSNCVLSNLLSRLVKINYLDVLPTGEVLTS